MGSSPGFGSNPGNSSPYSDSLSLRLRQSTALTKATERNSPAHSSIGTPSPFLRRTPTACRHAVSGSLSFPSRGAFHLSLTVLVHYRSPRVFSLGGWSPQLPTGFPVSRGTQAWNGSLPFSPTGLSPSLVALSRDLQLGERLVTPCGFGRTRHRALQPRRRIGPPTTESAPVWASPLSLAATQGIISFPRGTKMFQFPRLPRAGLCVQPVDSWP